jgi:hypothetical protein
MILILSNLTASVAEVALTEAQMSGNEELPHPCYRSKKNEKNTNYRSEHNTRNIFGLGSYLYI